MKLPFANSMRWGVSFLAAMCLSYLLVGQLLGRSKPDPLSAADHLGVRGDDHGRPAAGLRGGALKSLGGGTQIPRAVIDNRNRHLNPASFLYRLPLVDGTASARRGSISIARRKARARPLKQDSTMWWLLAP